MDNKELLHLLKEVNKLKHIKRRGWVLRNIAEPESVADHSYRTALISMFLSDQEGLDTEKVMKMALLHDIQEAVVGDITPVDAEYKDKDEIELQAIKKMLADYPQYIKVWEEFNAMSSPEAKLVCDADKIEMLLQAQEYEELGYEVSDFWEKYYDFTNKCKELHRMLTSERE